MTEEQMPHGCACCTRDWQALEARLQAALDRVRELQAELAGYDRGLPAKPAKPCAEHDWHVVIRDPFGDLYRCTACGMTDDPGVGK